MPRNMSFFHTADQIREKTKTVTRRLGWWFLTPGTILTACNKTRGLKRGELEKFCQIRVVSVRKERLDEITREDCRREGFPLLTPSEFVNFFVEHMDAQESTLVNRIEFEYLPDVDPLLYLNFSEWRKGI